MIGRTFAQTNPDAEKLYREREKGKLRCLFCPSTVWLSRRIKGLTTCSKHDGKDPKHARKREAGKANLELGREKKLAERRKGGVAAFPGVLAPRGAERVRKLRREAGLTQPELGALIGVSKFVVSAWERGRAAPSVAALRAVEEACRQYESRKEVEM